MADELTTTATFLGLICLGLLIWSLVWVYGDARERGRSGGLITFLVFLCSWPISLLFWMAARPDPDTTSHIAGSRCWTSSRGVASVAR